ncbi:transposase [Duganella levis]|nr:transposase [Duganella levis]
MQMTRPLRLEFAGALYHVTSRGDRQAPIYLDDTDRSVWLQTLGEVCQHFDFTLHSFCQMSNHYHLLLETNARGLSAGMRQLNGVYSQYFNRRHSVVGHLFQGRYKAILVQKESYLLELARYIVLNPVRAGMVQQPEAWPWSSYSLTVGKAPPQAWLNTQWLLTRFSSDQADAITAYRAFVDAGIGAPSPLTHTRHQLVLGDETFAASLRTPSANPQAGISRTQRLAQCPELSDYEKNFPDRNEAMARAYATGNFSVTAIARYFKVSQKTTARAIKRWRGP